MTEQRDPRPNGPNILTACRTGKPESRTALSPAARALLDLPASRDESAYRNGISACPLSRPGASAALLGSL